MQKLLLLIITMIIVLFASTTVLKGQDFSDKNSVETKTFNLGSFNAVKSSQAIEVEIVKATATSTVTLSVPEELTAEATSLAKIKYKTLSGIKFSAIRKSGGKIDSI